MMMGYVRGRGTSCRECCVCDLGSSSGLVMCFYVFGSGSWVVVDVDVC